jgi:hypothetical protein
MGSGLLRSTRFPAVISVPPGIEVDTDFAPLEHFAFISKPPVWVKAAGVLADSTPTTIVRVFGKIKCSIRKNWI